jgi:hypothetical protein
MFRIRYRDRRSTYFGRDIPNLFERSAPPVDHATRAEVARNYCQIVVRIADFASASVSGYRSRWRETGAGSVGGSIFLDLLSPEIAMGV